MTTKVQNLGLPNFANLSDSQQEDITELVEEFDELKKLKIFTDKEHNTTLGKLIVLQTKISDGSSSTAHYVQYIELQAHILKCVQQQGVERLNPRQSTTELMIVHKITTAYQAALNKYPDDHSMHVTYLMFCIKMNLKDDVIDWCIHFLQDDITNKKIWTIINDFYYHDIEDIKTAMWSILPSFSAKFISQILDPDSQLKEGDTRLKRLEDLFTMSFIHIKCSYYHISLLDGIKDDEIMRQLISNMKQNPWLWNALAQRLWRVDIKAEPSMSIDTTRSPKMRLEQAIVKYKEGICGLLPENKSALWCILINFLFSMNSDPENAISRGFKSTVIRANLTEGMPYLQEPQFLKWLKWTKDRVECLHISEKAVAILPKSVKLWSERLKYEMLKEDTSNLRSLFQVGIGNLQENSLALWKDMIEYTAQTGNSEGMEELFREGSISCIEVSSQIRPMYLEWLALQKGMKYVRAAYNILVETEPFSKEMHLKMLKLENILQEEFDNAQAEHVYKIACSQFRDDIALRISYIEYIVHLSRKQVIPDLPERLQALAKETINVLPPHLHEEFKAKYNRICSTIG